LTTYQRVPSSSSTMPCLGCGMTSIQPGRINPCRLSCRPSDCRRVR
jgi:hypothetical protein